MAQDISQLVKNLRFTIPDELIPKLRQLQAQTREYYIDEIAESEDAVVMISGMGRAMYLTIDGRVIIDDDPSFFKDEPPPPSPREATDVKDLFAAVIIGAKIRKSPELLSLLPPRPKEAVNCKNCESGGWQKFGKDIEIICQNCGGIGWIDNFFLIT